MRKRALAGIIMMVALIISGCGVNGNDNNDTSLPQVSEQVEVVDENVETNSEERDTKEDTEKSVEYPLSVTDQAGREIVIEKKPQTLVSSYYITTSAFIALGLTDEIVGIELNPEKRPIYGMCAPQLLEVTQVGTPKEFDLEVCASLQPDLVVLPMRAKDMVEPLEALGIPVVIVNPEGKQDILDMLTLLGEATDHMSQATALTEYIEEKTAYLEKTMEGCSRPTVYIGGNSSFLSTASKGMYQNDLISLAGGTNVAGEIDDTYWVESSFEQIIDWNPKAIVLASDAKYEREEILKEANLFGCEAIMNQEVYQIPSDIEAWDSPIPSSFLGAAYLASVLHPELVSTEEYEEMVAEYYETFYGFSYTQD